MTPNSCSPAAPSATGLDHQNFKLTSARRWQALLASSWACARNEGEGALHQSEPQWNATRRSSRSWTTSKSQHRHPFRANVREMENACAFDQICPSADIGAGAGNERVAETKDARTKCMPTPGVDDEKDIKVSLDQNQRELPGEKGREHDGEKDWHVGGGSDLATEPNSCPPFEPEDGAVDAYFNKGRAAHPHVKKPAKARDHQDNPRGRRALKPLDGTAPRNALNLETIEIWACRVSS